MGCGKGAIEFQEGRDLVGTSTMTPCRGFPQGVAGDGGEVIIGPTTLGLGDGLSEGLDGIFAGLASDGGDSSEGSLTVYVPPSEAPEVRRVPAFEQLPQDGINVRVEGICGAGKGGNVRDNRRR